MIAITPIEIAELLQNMSKEPNNHMENNINSIDIIENSEYDNVNKNYEEEE